MKTVMELLRNPIIKITGLVLVLYFALFYDKKNPDSLGNRLSSERIAKNFHEAQEKSTFIMSNIERAHNLRGATAATASSDPLQNFSTLTIQDVEIGKEGGALKCGDEAEISYDIRVAGSTNQLEFVPKEKLVIGSNVNPMIERKIVGMKKGGLRIIKIPKDFKSSNQKLAFLLKFNEAELKYAVSLINSGMANNSNVSCAANTEESNKNAQ